MPIFFHIFVNVLLKMPMLKQQLQQRLQQKLSPQQIQVIKMLEIPTLELEERIRQELEENPALEEGKEISEDSIDNIQDEDTSESSETTEELNWEDYIDDEDDIPDYKLYANNSSRDDKHEDIPFAAKDTFREHLLEQLNVQIFDNKTKSLAEYIIGNIDDEGYLRRSIDSMIDDIAFQTGISINEKEMLEALKIVQSFDPTGVGAQTLQECLFLQIKQRKKSEQQQLAQIIIERFFDEFTKKQYGKIAKRLNLSNEKLGKVIDEILKLNPKPGNTWNSGGESVSQTIIPDFIVVNENNRLQVMLNNQNIPDLKISSIYSNMIQDYAGNKKNQTNEMKDAVTFAKQKIDSARWFIDSIKQRNATLISTMEAIVKYQQQFFLSGNESDLKPMILKDISDMSKFDMSTISRVSNSKYVQTEFGVFPLKYFFSETMKTEDGAEISNKEIMHILQELIEEEDKQNPITDDKLKELLHEKGYIVARRTIAKYREKLGIPIARLRKKL